MTKTKYMTLALAFAALGLPSSAQIVQQTISNPKNIPAPVYPIPSDRQVAWYETEFYGFFHYGMDTFTNQEWGDGGELESQYAPTAIPNVEQWMTTVQSAGMKGAVVVAKHHDGFCLWPTKSTTHCVSNSGGVGPQVDIVKLGSAACKKLGLKFGVYLSPWDRNNSTYATDAYSHGVFLTQVTELCKNYGDLFEIWFDGANGGNGKYGGTTLITKNVSKYTYYDWANVEDSIHKMQPNAVVWGREFRWIGNESGNSNDNCWSHQDVQNCMDNNNLTSGYEGGFEWIPGESDAKSTSGWFWHSNQTYTGPERLYQMYLETVGRNATLILNVPPSTDGVLPAQSVTNMQALGNLLKTRLSTDLAKNATVTVSDTRNGGTGGDYSANNMIDGDKETYWAPNDGTSTDVVTLQWSTAQTIHYVALQEYIRLGQRVRKFVIETSNDGSTWTAQNASICSTIGYKRIVPVGNTTTSSYGTGVSAKYLRVRFTDKRACPLIHTLSVY